MKKYYIIFLFCAIYCTFFGSQTVIDSTLPVQPFIPPLQEPLSPLPQAPFPLQTQMPVSPSFPLPPQLPLMNNGMSMPYMQQPLAMPLPVNPPAAIMSTEQLPVVPLLPDPSVISNNTDSNNSLGSSSSSSSSSFVPSPAVVMPNTNFSNQNFGDQNNVNNSFSGNGQQNNSNVSPNNQNIDNTGSLSQDNTFSNDLDMPNNVSMQNSIPTSPMPQNQTVYPSAVQQNMPMPFEQGLQPIIPQTYAQSSLYIPYSQKQNMLSSVDQVESKHNKKKSSTKNTSLKDNDAKDMSAEQNTSPVAVPTIVSNVSSQLSNDNKKISNTDDGIPSYAGQLHSDFGAILASLKNDTANALPENTDVKSNKPVATQINDNQNKENKNTLEEKGISKRINNSIEKKHSQLIQEQKKTPVVGKNPYELSVENNKI